jgi:hypothetical protein
MNESDYIPTRLIDPRIISQLFDDNPLVAKGPSRLLLYDFPKKSIEPIKKINFNSRTDFRNNLDKKISKIKSSAFNKLLPELINGILFITVCLLIYYILYYKYNKKKQTK